MSTITDRMSIDRILRERPEQLHGFTVMAKDGEAGEVASSQEFTDDQHLAVRVGGILGMFAHDVAIEIDVITDIDPENQVLHVDRVAQWVKESPRVQL